MKIIFKKLSIDIFWYDIYLKLCFSFKKNNN